MRLVLAEDQALLRAGLVRIFAEAGHDVVADVGDAEALRTAVEQLAPDLAVVDIRMPPTHTDEGLVAARWIRDNHPAVSVLVLSQHVEKSGVVGLASQRGFGYLLKDRVLDVAEFIDAAERVAGGGSALDPDVVAGLMTDDAGRTRLGDLTPRELEVLALMAEGLSNAAIAERLFCTDRTVESHIGRVFTKLDLVEAGEGQHRRVRAVLSFLEASSA